MRRTRVRIGGKRRLVKAMPLDRGLLFVEATRQAMKVLNTTEPPLALENIRLLLQEAPGLFTEMLALLLGQPVEWVSRECTPEETFKALSKLLHCNQYPLLVDSARVIGLLND